jgi:hypothetical protein
MKNTFNVSEEEKNRIRGLHLTEQEIGDFFKPRIEPVVDDMGQCENCDNKFQWKDVPSGWDEDYCESCNEELNTYECRNCREEVETPDTFCSKDCHNEYHQ